ncbi:hypothetical protein COU37_03590 [Candidatus Micrarchaeota archaeon CG10_big_fil_rev_8_21_14_0_10_45_29]|nr:MAG: hypothetical protein COU37_03590 [Candidatus Micrarchaeota archaeon CG10_big_fil_rev_8_21_14_0_10_45_29]
MNIFKGQISAEYLMILGVVMLVALVAIGLTIFFTQGAWDISQSEISSYWATQAHPIRVTEMEGYYYGTSLNGEIALVLENVDTKVITIKNFIIEPYGVTETFGVYDAHHSTGAGVTGNSLGTAGVSQTLSTTIVLAPGEKEEVYLRPTMACSDSGEGRADTEKFYNELTIVYDTPYFEDISFKGAKPIGGRCNPV